MRRTLTFTIVATFFFLSSSFAASEQKSALIEELIQRTNTASLSGEFVVQLMRIGQQAESGGNKPDVSELKAMSPQMHQMLFDTFDRNFSESELRDVLAFFRSPVGKKFADTQLQIATAGRSVAAEQVTTELQGAIQRSKEKRTIADLFTLAIASEAYATDANRYPDAHDLEHLRALLQPTYVRNMPDVDGWGNPFVYAVSSNHQEYRFVSGGPDGKIEPGSMKIGNKAGNNDDIIYENGTWVQKPKDIDL